MAALAEDALLAMAARMRRRSAIVETRVAKFASRRDSGAGLAERKSRAGVGDGAEDQSLQQKKPGDDARDARARHPSQFWSRPSHPSIGDSVNSGVKAKS